MRRCFVVLALIFLLTACRSEEVDFLKRVNSEEVYVIAIENLSLGQAYKDTEEVEAAINEIVLPAINCRIDIVNYHIADHATKVTLAVAGGTKLDLINTGLTTTLSGHVADGAVIPLDELLSAYAPKLLEKQGALLEATTIDGKIYAIPGNLYPSKANGLGYNKDLLEANDLQFPTSVTYDSLTEIGRALKEKDPGAYLFNNADGSLSLFDVFYFCETFGVDFNYGVIFDPLNSTQIVNVYETKEYRDYVKRLRSWFESGLLPEDALTAGLTGQDVFNAGNVLLQQMNISPISEQIVHKKGLDFEEVLVQTTPNVLSLSSVQEYAWGISSTCEEPEKVMAFLELLYQNADLANLFNHGIEGKHYEKVSERIIRYPEGINGENVGYGHIFSMYGDAMQQYQFEPADESFYEELIRFSKEAQPLLTLGYSFDTKKVASEIAAVKDVVNEFRPLLESGILEEVDQALDTFLASLKEAGIDRIIMENQRQLDVWLPKAKGR